MSGFCGCLTQVSPPSVESARPIAGFGGAALVIEDQVAAAQVDHRGLAHGAVLPGGAGGEGQGRRPIGQLGQRRHLRVPDGRRAAVGGGAREPDPQAAAAPRKRRRIAQLGGAVAEEVGLVGRGGEVERNGVVGAGGQGRQVGGSAGLVGERAHPAGAGQPRDQQREPDHRPGSCASSRAHHQNLQVDDRPSSRMWPLAR